MDITAIILSQYRQFTHPELQLFRVICTTEQMVWKELSILVKRKLKSNPKTGDMVLIKKLKKERTLYMAEEIIPLPVKFNYQISW